MAHEILDGELWLDEQGRAVVVLPDHVHGRELESEYRLGCGDSHEACAELADGRLTITAATPHVKVAWRLAHRGPAAPAGVRSADPAGGVADVLPPALTTSSEGDKTCFAD